MENKRDYSGGLLPDWRVTCFFVDRAYRGRGVASVALSSLSGALAKIARLGGGTVESYPEYVAGQRVSAAFLHNATVTLFERHGFERVRRLGKNHWVVTTVVSPVTQRSRTDGVS